MTRFATLLLVTILSLSFALVPVGAQGAAAEPAYSLEDATGDVFYSVVTGVGSPGLPSAAYLSYIDFTEFSAEDVDPLTLRVRMATAAGFAPYEDQAILLGASLYHTFMFQIPGTESSPLFGIVTVYSYWEETNPQATRAVVSRVEFCVNAYEGDRYCGLGSLLLNPVFEDGALIVDVPKQAMTKGGPLGPLFPQLPSKIRSGDALTHVEILAYTQLLGYTRFNGESPSEMRDQVPNDGAAPDFVFEHPSVTDDLNITLSQLGAVAGEENIVGMQIKNLADRKRVLDLDLEITEMEGDWTITTVPNVTVRARDTINVTMRVIPPPSVGGKLPWVAFQVRANVLTEPGVIAAVPAYLVASAPLDADANRWFAHTGVAQGIPFLPVPHDLFTFREAWASRTETETSAPDTLGAPLYFAGGSGGSDFATTLFATDGIPNPVKLTGKEAVAHFVIDSPYPTEGTLTSRLGTPEKAIAAGSAHVSLQRGLNEIDVTMPLDASATRLVPADGLIQWDIVLHRPGLDALALAAASFVDNPDVVPKQSWFEIPMTREVVIPPDPDLPDLSLVAAEDPDAFINPGRRTVFEWDLRNEHEDVIEVELVVENMSRQWSHEVGPAASLRIPSGESVRVGVLLDAPEGAKEGEICEFRLLVREPSSGRVFAGGAARAIVTAGVDVENETFEVDEDDRAAIKQAEGKSPGPGPFAMFATLAVAAAFHVRRRRVGPR